MFTKLIIWSISYSFDRLGWSEYHYLALDLLYADGFRLSNYKEDHVPLIF